MCYKYIMIKRENPKTIFRGRELSIIYSECFILTPDAVAKLGAISLPIHDLCASDEGMLAHHWIAASEDAQLFLGTGVRLKPTTDKNTDSASEKGLRQRVKEIRERFWPLAPASEQERPIGAFDQFIGREVELVVVSNESPDIRPALYSAAIQDMLSLLVQRQPESIPTLVL